MVSFTLRRARAVFLLALALGSVVPGVAMANWGDNWGQFNWGAPQVPLASPVGLVFMSALLLVVGMLAVQRGRRRVRSGTGKAS